MMEILIDSREKLPYEFTIPNRTATMATGDYSIAGAENLVAIERKTVDDLVACLSRHRERFQKELHRGRALQYFALIIESSLADLIRGNYTSKMSPEAAVQSLLAFSVRYGLPVFFAENRKLGAHLTASLLQKFAREMEKNLKAMSSVTSAHHPEN